MHLITFLLICAVVYLLLELNKLKIRVDLADKSSTIEHELIRNFIRKADVLKKDVERYSKEPFFDWHWRDSCVFGEKGDVLQDRQQFYASLKEEDFDYSPDPEYPIDKKAEELLNVKIVGVISLIQSANPNVIDRSYVDWLKAKEELKHMTTSLGWMLPEIESKLVKNKVAPTEDFIKLKEAMTADDLMILIPDLFENARKAVVSEQ